MTMTRRRRRKKKRRRSRSRRRRRRRRSRRDSSDLDRMYGGVGLWRRVVRVDMISDHTVIDTQRQIDDK